MVFSTWNSFACKGNLTIFGIFRGFCHVDKRVLIFVEKVINNWLQMWDSDPLQVTKNPKIKPVSFQWDMESLKEKEKKTGRENCIIQWDEYA